MKLIIFKAISFYEVGKEEKGYYFYDSPDFEDYGHIVGMPSLTLPMAIQYLKDKGIDVIGNMKMNIKAYPY